MTLKIEKSKKFVNENLLKAKVEEMKDIKKRKRSELSSDDDGGSSKKN